MLSLSYRWFKSTVYISIMTKCSKQVLAIGNKTHNRGLFKQITFQDISKKQSEFISQVYSIGI